MFNSDANGTLHGESQWQVAADCNSFDTPIVDIWKNYENWYFEDEGLYVMLEAQANWKGEVSCCSRGVSAVGLLARYLKALGKLKFGSFNDLRRCSGPSL